MCATFQAPERMGDGRPEHPTRRSRRMRCQAGPMCATFQAPERMGDGRPEHPTRRSVASRIVSGARGSAWSVDTRYCGIPISDRMALNVASRIVSGARGSAWSVDTRYCGIPISDRMALNVCPGPSWSGRKLPGRAVVCRWHPARPDRTGQVGGVQVQAGLAGSCRGGRWCVGGIQRDRTARARSAGRSTQTSSPKAAAGHPTP